MIFKRKRITIAVLLALVCFLSFLSVPPSQGINADNKHNSRPQIILGAGHAALENTIKQPKSIAK